jgi:hypothetical protein
MAGMKSINIEKLIGHSLGMSTNSYYRATSDEILKDYLKAAPFLTISSDQTSKTNGASCRKVKERQC